MAVLLLYVRTNSELPVCVTSLPAPPHPSRSLWSRHALRSDLRWSAGAGRPAGEVAKCNSISATAVDAFCGKGNGLRADARFKDCAVARAGALGPIGRCALLDSAQWTQRNSGADDM